MKKTAAVVLCTAMMLTACGGASTTETTAAGSQAASSEAASSAEETKTASGDAQKLVLSTYGLSEDISEEEVYTPFENEFSCERRHKRPLYKVSGRPELHHRCDRALSGYDSEGH